MISILYGRSWEPQGFDDGFEREAAVAEALGMDAAVVHLEGVVHDNAEWSVRELPEGRAWVYRGWMLSTEEYGWLYDAVEGSGGYLAVTAEEHAAASYVSEWALELEDWTPPTAWTEGEDPAEAWELAQQLGAGPWILKDHVKSAKEEWDACFVPADATYEEFAYRVERMITLRGDRFERGIVVRKMEPLVELGYRIGERELTEEHRLFFVDGELAAHAPYFEVGAPLDDLTPFHELGERIASPFYSVDVGRKRSGGWTVLDVGDGGSTGLPAQMDPEPLYEALRQLA